MLKKLNLSLLPSVFALAWPTMLEQLMQTAVQYIDTAMVGSLGTAATAAVGSTTTVNWLISSSISALGVGFLAFISRASGAKNKELTLRVSSQAVLSVLLVGVLSTVLTLSLSGVIPVWMQVDEAIRETASQYFFILYAPMLFRTATIIFGALLRGAGDAKTPMRVGIIVNIVNVFLNFLLIYETRAIGNFTVYGLGLGVQGAAIASAVSFGVGGVLITLALFRHKEISPKKQFLKPDFEVLKPCLKIALPNMLQRFATSLGYVAFASMINSVGEVATAAHTIANTVESAFYIPGYGMQAAAATLMGNTLGAKDRTRAKEISQLLIVCEVVLMIFSGALLFFFAGDMMRIFANSEDVVSLGSTVLRMVALSEPFYGVSLIIEGMMQGVGNTKRPFVYNIIGMWGIRIVGTFVCIELLSMGLVSAWGCMIAHNLFLFCAFTMQYRKGKWNPLFKKAVEQ